MLHQSLSEISFLTTGEIYDKALDCITNAIADHFDQQDFEPYIKLKNFFIKAVKGVDLLAEYNDHLSIYRKDFDENRFKVQLETLLEYCKEHGALNKEIKLNHCKKFSILIFNELYLFAKSPLMA